jgi:hypothetical protein
MAMLAMMSDWLTLRLMALSDWLSLWIMSMADRVEKRAMASSDWSYCKREHAQFVPDQLVWLCKNIYKQ